MSVASDSKAIRQLLERDASRPPVPAQVQHLPLLEFIPAVTPHFQPPMHLAPIARHLEATEHRSVRLVCNAPPRHGKTETLLHFIAWCLVRDPRKTVGFASHSAALALSKSRLAREYARRAGVQIKDDSDAVHEWRTTAGGGCLAAGVFGSWVGQGVDRLIIDDPFADRSEADSPLIRSRVRDWYQSVASTRIEPNGSIVVSHTRWHENDLSGWLLTESDERHEYEHVNLPVLDGSGNALWPARWPVSELLKKKAAVGPYEWSSLYLGAPVARGGEVFKGSPARYEKPTLDGARLVIAIDPAGTTGEHSDYTAVVVLAVRNSTPTIEAPVHPEAYFRPHLRPKPQPPSAATMVADVLEVARWKAEPTESAHRLAALRKRYQGASTYIESSRDGKQIVRTLETIDPTLHFIEVPPYASKLMRAGPAAGAWEEGRIRLPLAAPWLEDFLYEVQRFTGVGDGKDDMCDALSLAINASVPMIHSPASATDPSPLYDESGHSFFEE